MISRPRWSASRSVGRWGFLTVNDIRKAMGMNPIGPEGDVYLYPTNMGDAAQLLKDAMLIPVTQEPAPQDPPPQPATPKGKKKPNEKQR